LDLQHFTRKKDLKRERIDNGEREKFTPEQRVDFQLKKMTKDLRDNSVQPKPISNKKTANRRFPF
jgi:hypothetical protein